MVSKPKKRQPGGRPKIDDADRRDTLVRVLTTATEYEELQEAAAYIGMSVSTWLRSVALERARTIAAEKAKAEKAEK